MPPRRFIASVRSLASGALDVELPHIEPVSQSGNNIHLGLDDGQMAILDLNEAFEERAAFRWQFPHDSGVKKARFDLNVEGPFEKLHFHLFRFGGHAVPEFPDALFNTFPGRYGRAQSA